jgi:hypothetical protein
MHSHTQHIAANTTPSIRSLLSLISLGLLLLRPARQ